MVLVCFKGRKPSCFGLIGQLFVSFVSTSFKIKLHFSYAAAILAHPTLCLARLRKVPLSMMKVK